MIDRQWLIHSSTTTGVQRPSCASSWLRSRHTRLLLIVGRRYLADMGRLRDAIQCTSSAWKVPASGLMRRGVLHACATEVEARDADGDVIGKMDDAWHRAIMELPSPLGGRKSGRGECSADIPRCTRAGEVAHLASSV